MADAKPQAKPHGQSVLEALDGAETSWYHIKTVIIAGMGFFCDAYDLFSISLITKTIGRVYYPDIAYFSHTDCLEAGYYGNSTVCGSKYSKIINEGVSPADARYYVPGAMPPNIDSAIKGVALCGTLTGQLIFGYLGDRYGRKKVFGLTLWLMIAFALMSGLSFGSTPDGVVGTLCVARFFLGVGVGGDYPLSATLMSEYSSKSNRGRFVAAVFAMQGTGILFAAIVSIVVSSIFMGHNASADYIWRIVLMFGAVPTAATMYARLGMPETSRFTMFVQGDAAKAAKDMGQVLGREVDATETVQRRRDFTWRQFLRKFGVQLFGCASTWFLLDIAFYSQNLFQSDVFTAIGWLPPAYTMDVTTEAFRIARAQALIALCSTIPGYWMTVATIEKMGRFKIQVMGFVMMTLFMAILAGDYTSLKSNHVPTFVALYALTFFFANWGPNSTTFVIPAELFPSKYRSTAHGISAAWGKAGAIIGTFGFGTMKDNIGLQKTIGILAAVNFAGLLCTYFVPETKNKTLEELGGDIDYAIPTDAEAVEMADGINATKIDVGPASAAPSTPSP